VGDVYDMKTGVLRARAANCFPKLSVVSAPSTIPAVSRENGTGISAAFGVSGVADAELAREAADGFTLVFDDVKVISASILDLSSKLSSACSFLRPLLNTAMAEAFPDSTKLFLVTEVFEGRRRLMINAKTESAAQGKIGNIAQILAKFGVDLKARAGVAIKGKDTIEIIDTHVVPISIRPAVIPLTQAENVTLGSNTSTAVDVNRWRDFNPVIASNQVGMARWLDQFAVD
jgi:hypothetical protein